MLVVPPAPLRIATVALGITATGLFVEPISAAPPTAFRVSPRVMQRLRGAPAPAPKPVRESVSEKTVPVEPAPAPAPVVSTKSEAPATPVLTPSEPPPASPSPAVPAESAAASPGDAPAAPDDWAPGEDVEERPWRWIVVHHTATAAGSVEAIHRAHSRRRDAAGNPWRGIGYHFLIGNGDGMSDGAVEATFRWRDQLAGAHAGRRAENERGVGVCLVGDFEAADPTPAQLDAARRLIAFLRDRYDIPADRVLPHDAVSATACPGKKLTVEMLLESAAEPAPSPAPAPGWDDDEEYLPTGLSAPDVPAGPSLSLPRIRSQDAS